MTSPRQHRDSYEDSHSPAQRALPPEVYQRRRIAAVVVVLLVVVGLWLMFSKIGGGGESQNTAETSSTQQTSTTPDMTSPKEPPRGKETGTKSGEKSEGKETETAEAAAKSTCTVEDLEVTAVPGADSFAPEQQPNFFVKISNPTGAKCDIDLDEHPLQFEVFTLHNYQRVWGDLDCNNPSQTGTLSIEAGKTANYEMGSWSRTTSAPEQCQNRQPVAPGAYLLYAKLGDNVSRPATFNLG